MEFFILNKNIILRNPFRSLKLKTKSPSKQKLTTGEVYELTKHDFTNIDCLEKVRDIFMFSIYTGLAYSDAMELSVKHLHTTSTNGLMLVINRKKTDEETKLFLVQQATDIIIKYKEFQNLNTNGYLLPRMSNQQLNLRLKILAEKVGIYTKLTSHIARHTYSQFVRAAGVTDTLTKNKMMGHSSGNNIRDIYEGVIEIELFQAKEKFQVFLDEILKKNETKLL